MKRVYFIYIVGLVTINLFGQSNQIGMINGEFNLNLKSYQEDKSIGAEEAEEIILNNAYLNLNFTRGNFATGIRYESYLNALEDYDPEFRGNGIPYKFATYSIDGLEITAGNYYEQLGSGLIFRSYEEKGLGIDNAMDGIRLKYTPSEGIYFKTFIGKSRTHFTYAESIFRGVDGEFNINEILKNNAKTQIRLGISGVSRYQERENPIFELPQNVGAYSGRLDLRRGGFSYAVEYGYKINDPANISQANEINYASGSAIKNNLSFSKKGLAISLDLHRIDNMEFKSDRDKDGKAFIINYIPTLSKQHSYSLLALYPYATQSNGEIGVQADIFLKIKKGSIIGGKYGTKISLNASRMNALSGDYGKSVLNDEIDYTPIPLCFAQDLYFQDINLEIERKINKKVRTIFILANQIYDRDFIEQHTVGEYGVLSSTIFVSDISYKLNKRNSIRFEIQALKSQQIEDFEDQGPYANGLERPAEGDWYMLGIEYTISKLGFISIQDMYNAGHEDPDKRLHYLNVNIGYQKGANRFEIGYGKKRAGIFCAGGVCKLVPSSNGFSLTISSTF